MTILYIIRPWDIVVATSWCIPCFFQNPFWPFPQIKLMSNVVAITLPRLFPALHFSLSFPGSQINEKKTALPWRGFDLGWQVNERQLAFIINQSLTKLCSYNYIYYHCWNAQWFTSSTNTSSRPAKSVLVCACVSTCVCVCVRLPSFVCISLSAYLPICLSFHQFI